MSLYILILDWSIYHPVLKASEKPAPLHSVNRHDTLMTALHSMLQNKEHLLSVVDDRGHCVGIVTLENIAGELLSADIEQFR